MERSDFALKPTAIQFGYLVKKKKKQKTSATKNKKKKEVTINLYLIVQTMTLFPEAKTIPMLTS